MSGRLGDLFKRNSGALNGSSSLRFVMGALRLALLLLAMLAVCTSAQTAPAYNGLRLEGARITGTTEMSSEDLLRGLELHAGEPITLSAIRMACHRLEDIQIYRSINIALMCNSHN